MRQTKSELDTRPRPAAPLQGCGSATTATRGEGVDRLGALASAACALHCAACALLPGALTALGLSALLEHEAEWGLTLAAVSLAASSLVIGWRRHRSSIVVLTLGGGIAGLLLARVVEETGGHGLGAALGILAGLAILAGHVSNIGASRRCQGERA